MKQDKDELLPCYVCGEKVRLCYTGKLWKITCDTEDCSCRDCYGKTSEIVCNKWNSRTPNQTINKEIKGTFIAIRNEITLVTSKGSIKLMPDFVAQLLNEAYKDKDLSSRQER